MKASFPFEGFCYRFKICTDATPQTCVVGFLGNRDPG